MKKITLLVAFISVMMTNVACAKTNTKNTPIQQNVQNTDNVPVMSCVLENNHKVSVNFNKKDIAYKYAIQDETGKVKTSLVKADEVEQYYAIDGDTYKREYKILAYEEKTDTYLSVSISDKVLFNTFECKKNTISVNPKALRYGQANADRKDFGEVYVYE